ncbi:MAG: hypothetical protein AAF065_09955 [Verrucomicrobiota bacterium]
MRESGHKQPEKHSPRVGNLIIPPTMESMPVKKRSKAKPYRKTGIKGYLTIILLGVLAFAPIFMSELLWTEYDSVERSVYQSMEDWTDAWTLENIRYEDPITISSFFAENVLPIPAAQVHRAINLLLHLTAAFLLLKILEALELAGALAASLVFTLHPVVLQTLFWPGYRNELVGLILIFLSVYFGIKNRNATDFVAMLLISALAAMVHSAALTIPLIIFFCILYRKDNFRLEDYNRLLPVFCLLVLIGVWTHAEVKAEELEEGVTFPILVGGNLYHYIRQSLVPLQLALFHPFRGGIGFSVGATNSLLPVLLFVPFYILIAVNYRQRWARGLLLGLSSFLLLLIYGLTQTGRFIDGTMAKEDHAAYIALPAIIALVICGLSSFFKRFGSSGKRIGTIAISLFLMIQISVTAGFSYAVSDTQTLWKNISEQWPDSWVPKVAFLQTAQSNEDTGLNERNLIRLLESILEQSPDLHRERILLARSYLKLGQSRNALREYRRVLRDTDPSNEFLEEAAQVLDNQGLQWEATNARERIKL